MRRYFFGGGQVVPTFYDDVNNDGKLEYLWTKYTSISDKNEMQWLSIDGSLVMDLKTIKDNGIIASNIIVSRDLKLQKLNAEPYSGFAFYGVDSSIKGKVLIPRNGSYVYHEFDMKNTTGATWADVNLDGLEDLLYWDNSDGTYRPYFKLQKKDGTFMTQPVPVVTDPEELKSAQYAMAGNGAFTIRTNGMTAFASPNSGYYSKDPMTVVDLNLDGYPDFIDEKGYSLISLGNGKYYSAAFSGRVKVADVNGDGLTDLIVYSNGELKLKLNTGAGFTEKSLLNNNAVDGIHVLDCNGDGLLDILVTVPGKENSFIAFFKNQGNGTFKRTVKSFTGEYKWTAPYFINNNGLPSLFTVDNFIYNKENPTYGTLIGGLVTIWNWDSGFKVTPYSVNQDTPYALKLPPRDIDGDGKMVFPAFIPRRNDGAAEKSGIFRYAVDKVNTAPKKMKAPGLVLDKSIGMLRAEWEAGSDAENATGDLSYEFEISSGGEYLYRTYTKSLFALAAAGGWGKNSVSARVRAIDACGMKGEWSDYAQLNDISQLATFSIDKKTVSTCDTVFVSSLNGQDFTLRGTPDGTIVTSADGRRGIMFDTFGKKQIEGTSSAGLTFALDVDVLPFRIVSIARNFGGVFFDYFQEGRILGMNWGGLYVYNKEAKPDYNNGTFEKLPVFGLSDGVDSDRLAVFDANMDGLPDVLCKPSPTDDRFRTQAVINLGDGDFEKSTDAYTYDGKKYYVWDSYYYVDLNNDGLLDYCSYDSDASKYKVYYNNGDGTFTSQPLDFGDYTLGGFVSGSFADYDRDGRIDALASLKNKNNKNCVAVAFNNGNGKFDVMEIKMPANSGLSSDAKPYDVDGDGYMDYVSSYEILKNMGNRTFEVQQIHSNNRPVYIDFDLDGKLDYQSSNRMEFTISNNGSPVTFENLQPKCFIGTAKMNIVDIDNDGVPDCEDGVFLTKQKCINTPPTAPTTVYANQKNGEVVISWSGATDKESTNAQLRYNISIKKKGETGEGSYVWSPLNADDDNAKMAGTGIQTYYRQATTLPMPISRFEAGKTYEIRIQTLDPWMAHSPFSKVIEFTPTETTLVSLPEKAGVGQAVKASVESNVGEITLTTDDGEVRNDGTIVWSTPGLKTVQAVSTANSQVKGTARIMIYEQPSLEVNIPEKVLAGQTIVVNMPECFRNEDAKVSVSADNAEVSYDKKSNQAVVAISEDAAFCSLKLNYSDDVWNPAVKKNYDIEVVGAGWQPQLTQVTVADGHNVLEWNAGQALPDASIFTGKVNVYRETNVADSYEKIGEIALANGRFVDTDSRPDVKSNRYMITLPTVYGVESAPSRVHASVHLMVNKGMGNDINLHWTPYEGADISQYMIFAGATPDNMQVVETLSGYSRSYVHHRSSDDVTYYAIGMKQKSGAMKSRGMRAEAKQENVTSNVISSKEAYAVKLVTHIEIQTEETDATISETQTTLHLKAWVTPVLATIANVEWSIVEGAEFATIDKNGVFTANMGSKAGSVVVQAKAIDGSEVVALRTFDIPQSTGISAVTDGASAVTILSGYGNIFVKNASGLMTVTTASGAVVHRSVVEGERKVYLPAGIYIVKIGKTVRKVVVR